MATVRIRGTQEDTTPENAIIDIDLVKRQINGPRGYTVAVEGDNQSQLLTFKIPRQFDNIDLASVKCDIEYYTTWVDDDGNHSYGSVQIYDEQDQSRLDTNPKDYPDNYLFTWLLDYKQTAKTGNVYYLVKFYSVDGVIAGEQSDPWILKTQASTIAVVDDNLILASEEGGGGTATDIHVNNGLVWLLWPNT